MGNLPNAPLIEVILELRWQITNKSDLAKIQYLYGDIYNELKNKYPYREIVQPIELPSELVLNSPVHRYRASLNSFPLIQLGPGLMTLNMDKVTYSWDIFLENTNELINSFLKIFPFQNQETITPSLLFLDFFKFNYEELDVYDFLNDKFNINFSQSFLPKASNPTNLNLGFYYITEMGELMLTFNRGKNLEQDDGILVQTRINGQSSIAEIEQLTQWIEKAHNFCSDIFKRLTEGELYESFNKEIK